MTIAYDYVFNNTNGKRTGKIVGLEGSWLAPRQSLIVLLQTHFGWV